MRKLIGVIGGTEAPSDILALAEEVGRLIARSGSVLVCGGLGGVMEAACRGAREEGGLTVGILPGPAKEDANPHVDIAIATNLGYARNAIISQTSDALIAVGGRYGTLSEIAHALQSDIPVIGLNTWALAQKGQPDESIIVAQNPAEAVSKALSLARD